MPPNSLESQDLSAFPLLQSPLNTAPVRTAILSDAALEEQYGFNLTSSGFCFYVFLRHKELQSVFRESMGVEKRQQGSPETHTLETLP